MKKFVCLAVVIIVVAMFGAFVGTLFANSVFANANKSDSVQTVVATPNVVTSEATVEPTSEPTAEPVVIVEPTAEATTAPESTIEPTSEPTAEPVAVEATVEPTATPIVEAISEDQISWADFLVEARYSDNSFNAVNVGAETGRVNFTDENLMVHVGEELAVNVASRSVSVKFEGVEHVKYESASVKVPNLGACRKHAALARRHSRAYGDNITIKLTSDDITNIATYAAYWYDKTGKLTYGFVVCGCANGAGSGSGSSNGSSDNGGAHPSDEPTAAPTQEPQPTAKPTNESTAVPAETPQPPKVEATNSPDHSDQGQEPQLAVKNTPPAPAQDYVGSNQHAHNEQPKTTDGAQVDDASGNPNHSDLVVEEADVAYTPAEDLGGAVPPAPAENMVASIPSAPAEDFVASISSDTEAEENVVTDVEIAMNIPSFSDMPKE